MIFSNFRSAVRRPLFGVCAALLTAALPAGVICSPLLCSPLLCSPLLAEESFQWTLRQRRPTEAPNAASSASVSSAPSSARFHIETKDEQWPAEETALIVCDMWDLHHCLNATRRVEELAPRMNKVLEAARSRGALIIHAPSSCMAAYADHPGRRRAQQAPAAPDLPDDIGQWCRQIPSEERGAYPIDQTDGGEDDDPQEHAAWAATLAEKGLNPRAPWTRQFEGLRIDERDVISDSGVEIWNVLHERGVNHVVLLGVHTNMCVLGRPFGLRQLVRHGKRVALMRDMTDTMYNPQRAPYVSHFTGTDLIVEHIEKWVCPTVSSDQLLGGEPFRFRGDRRPHVVIVMAEREYQTNETLPAFAAAHLGKAFRVTMVHANEQERNDLPGIEALRTADALVLSVRRRVLPAEQMRIVRDYVASGKPVIGIRTASHAFSLRNESPPEGLADWPEFDRDVLGGHYTNHHGNGPVVRVEAAVAASHPILEGVDIARLRGFGSLYQVSPLAAAASPLLVGEIEGKPAEPIAWTHASPAGGRVFYTSLGHVKDFDQPAMSRLLLNAIRWAVAAPVASEKSAKDAP